MELLLGQTAVVNLQMAPAGVAETLTVSGEAPLIETTTSTLGGNIDPRQMAELPVNGRNWINLALLAPEADLYQLGMTSHASVNVMLALEGVFDIEFPDSMLKRSVFSSIESIRNAIRELTSA